MESNRAAQRGALVVKSVGQTEAPPKLGIIGQHVATLDASLTDIQNILAALEKRLNDVLLPQPDGEGLQGAIREQSAPMANYLENLSEKSSYIRDYLQDILRRVAL